MSDFDLFRWTPARLIKPGDVICSDAKTFQVITCAPALFGRIALTVVNLDTGKWSTYRVRKNAVYGVAVRNLGGGCGTGGAA